MNKFLKFLALALLIGSANLSKAQIVAWQFALPTPTKGVEKSIKATTNDQNLETSLLTRGPSAIGKQGNGRGFSGNFPVDANLDEAKKSGSYFQFEVKPKAGFEVSLSSLTASLRIQEQSAHVYKWTYSLDGKNFTDVHQSEITITNKTNNGVTQEPISLVAIKELQHVPATKTITFRIYAWGGLTPEGKAIAFGFGKSDAKGSNALALEGTVAKK